MRLTVITVLYWNKAYINAIKIYDLITHQMSLAIWHEDQILWKHTMYFTTNVVELSRVWIKTYTYQEKFYIFTIFIILIMGSLVWAYTDNFIDIDNSICITNNCMTNIILSCKMLYITIHFVYLLLIIALLICQRLHNSVCLTAHTHAWIMSLPLSLITTFIAWSQIWDVAERNTRPLITL